MVHDELDAMAANVQHNYAAEASLDFECCTSKYDKQYLFCTQSQCHHLRNPIPVHRFAALVELESALHENPHKKLLVRALELKQGSKFDSVVDLFLNEILLTGIQSNLPHANALWSAIYLPLMV